MLVRRAHLQVDEVFCKDNRVRQSGQHEADKGVGATCLAPSGDWKSMRMAFEQSDGYCSPKQQGSLHSI